MFMKHYRSKPIVIQAVQFDGTYHCALEIMSMLDPKAASLGQTGFNITIQIPTPEGIMTAKPTDWIIKGTHGEFYPCRDDVFKTKYEPVEGV
jgi:hypothetical protein